ncbi:MAG: tripartite tricarboxylate transporter permease [Desulfomonile tiedjei]|uniref:Tripartite tricarboxylate transporter permease n=1 Tax=Desulfomonile tiedjei TaxID=2358 RepID=A0A9D6V6G3_9BACT|nr:tripartite tricarboxylate transporter permease [Desulfomonile tiedjei]
MDLLSHIALGAQIIFTPSNLLFCFIGVLMGTLVGVLPGLGPTAAIALLLPNTFHFPPVSALIMLAGIYYGAMYGGSTTSILVNIPGEAASVVTCLDGYQMARKGRAGPALGIAAMGSFIAGTLSILALMLVAPPMAKVALAFGPPEYFSLTLLGLLILIYLASSSILKALMMAVFGLLIGTIGMDSISATHRLTFGVLELSDGVGLIPVIMGVFGVAEVITNVEDAIKQEVVTTKVKNLLPSIQDWKDSFLPIIRGSFLGFFIGILPGPAPVISAFSSYALEKKISKYPEKFGTGVIEAVAGPEAANNSATGGAFIPLFTLGIPSNSVIAILLGAFMIFGIQPGPLLISQHPELFWGTIMSMYVGNAMLLVLNLPLIGIWVKLLKVPYPILFPLILVFCLVGVYSLNDSLVEVAMMIGFGCFGYVARKFRFEMAPLILALVIGPMMEQNLRLSLVISQGSPWIFVEHPISATLIAICLSLLISPLVPWIGGKRKQLQQKVEGEEV